MALDEDLEAARSQLDEAIREGGASVTHDPLPVLPVDRVNALIVFALRDQK